MNLKKYFTTKNIMIAVTFILILVTSIIFKQNPLIIAPVFVSLFIMAFQADANRYAYLAGSLNSVVYAGVYAYLGLYASALSALLVSFPLQFATFINWKKRAYKNSVVFKKMSASLRVIISIGFVISSVTLYIILKAIGSDYAVFDNISTLIGIMVSVLTLLAYIEYSYLWLISGGIQVILNFQVMNNNNPEHITYVIFSLYSAYCIVMAFINVRKLYSEQRKAEI